MMQDLHKKYLLGVYCSQHINAWVWCASAKDLCEMSDSQLQSATYLAHLDDTGRCQMLSEHLTSVSEITSRFSAKIGLGTPGALIGLLHDLGKYSNAFQQYLRLMSKDQDTEPCHMEKGSVDHSTAGAQTIWRSLAPKGKVESIAERHG